MAFKPDEHFRKVQGGQAYLDVKYRAVWLRDPDIGKPDWGIETELVCRGPLSKWNKTKGEAYERPGVIFKAVVRDTSGRIIGSGYGSETAEDFPEWFEKAETKAVGRALAMAGFGTAQAAELDEEDEAGKPNIADSPVEQKAPKAFTPNSDPATALNHESTKDTGVVKCGDCGAAVDGYKVGSRVITAEEVIRSSTALVGHPLCRQCYALHKTPTATK